MFDWNQYALFENFLPKYILDRKSEFTTGYLFYDD